MAEPILAKDVIIQFLSGSDYITYGCAAELETTFSMETKSVKTIGDGVWRRKRGQSLGQVINLSGVIIKDASVPDAFDLLDYFKNMLDVEFKIQFFDETGLAQTLKGVGLPTEVTLSSGSEGFSTGSIMIEVNGDPDYVDLCVAEIETAGIANEGLGGFSQRITITALTDDSPTITRYDWQLDGGGIQSQFTDGTLPTSWVILVPGAMGSDHTVVITPICDNGYEGEPYIINFTKHL